MSLNEPSDVATSKPWADWIPSRTDGTFDVGGDDDELDVAADGETESEDEEDGGAACRIVW